MLMLMLVLMPILMLLPASFDYLPDAEDKAEQIDNVEMKKCMC